MCGLFFIFSADCEERRDSADCPQKRRNIEPLETDLCTGVEGGGAATICLSCQHQQPSFGCCQNQAPVISVCLPAASAQTRPVSTTLALTAAQSPSSPLYPSAPLTTVLASSYPSEFALPVSPFPPPPHPIAVFFFFLCHSSPLNPQLLSHAGPGDTCGDCVLNGFFIRFIKGKAAA